MRFSVFARGAKAAAKETDAATALPLARRRGAAHLPVPMMNS